MNMNLYISTGIPEVLPGHLSGTKEVRVKEGLLYCEESTYDLSLSTEAGILLKAPSSTDPTGIYFLPGPPRFTIGHNVSIPVLAPVEEIVFLHLSDQLSFGYATSLIMPRPDLLPEDMVGYWQYKEFFGSLRRQK